MIHSLDALSYIPLKDLLDILAYPREILAQGLLVFALDDADEVLQFGADALYVALGARVEQDLAQQVVPGAS